MFILSYTSCIYNFSILFCIHLHFLMFAISYYCYMVIYFTTNKYASPLYLRWKLKLPARFTFSKELALFKWIFASFTEKLQNRLSAHFPIIPCRVSWAVPWTLKQNNKKRHIRAFYWVYILQKKAWCFIEVDGFKIVCSECLHPITFINATD